MRIKSVPRRVIRRSSDINCINLASRYRYLGEWRPLLKSEEDVNIVAENMNKNRVTEKNQSLNLSMSQQPLCHQQCNESPTTKIIDSSSIAISDVAVDLSIKTMNLNLAPMNDINFKSKIPSASQNGREFKTLFLYKMLTDSTFIDKIKKMKQSNLILCEYCKRSFSSQLDLHNHQNQMTDGIKNQISCCACNKIFSQRRYLRYHQRSHSEQSKFACEICTRKYSRMDNLTRHNTFHTNPNKFPCTLCERTFARKDLLNKHIKGHENKYRYYCDKCNKYFKGPLSLRNHNRSYHPTL